LVNNASSFFAATDEPGRNFAWCEHRDSGVMSSAAELRRGHPIMQDLFSLQGRVALITGGSRGIGEMIAEGFLKSGAKVYISARKAGPCEETAKRLSEFGECVALPADASGLKGAKLLAERYLANESKLDILVNNAGAAWGADFATFPEHGWDKVMDINVKTPFFLTQALHGALKNAASPGKPAKVINIASIDGLSVNMQETYSYAASKSGIIHLTKRMALGLAKDGIIVSAIAPGAFPSEMNKLARDDGDRIAKGIPSGRIGDKNDMAGAAIFLASRAGDYVVGATLVVDGGVAWTRQVFE
jgi:NAD(P)-dependent dehydrogenase (short-subunit alcohol dehydrogenase family)